MGVGVGGAIMVLTMTCPHFRGELPLLAPFRRIIIGGGRALVVVHLIDHLIKDSDFVSSSRVASILRSANRDREFNDSIRT